MNAQVAPLAPLEHHAYLLDLLSRGVQQSIAAAQAGVSQSYLSQLLKDEDFLLALERKRSERFSERQEKEAKASRIHGMYLELEEEVLKNLKLNMGMLRTGEKVRLLQALASKKAPTETSSPLEGQNSGPATVVNIRLPQAAATRFIMDQNRDIIGIEQVGAVGEASVQKELLPLPTQALKRLSQERQQARAQISDASGIMGMFSADSDA